MLLLEEGTICHMVPFFFDGNLNMIFEESTKWHMVPSCRQLFSCTRFILKVPGLLTLLKCLVSDPNRNYMWRKMNTRPVI